MAYYIVKVKVHHEDDKGKVKKVTEQYLVDAVSVTDAEVKVTKEFFGLSIDESGCLLSEDYHFCELWRKHGGKVHANPFIKLQHVGTYIYGGDIIKAGGNLK